MAATGCGGAHTHTLLQPPRACRTVKMDSNMKTPNAKKPLDSPPQLLRKSEITDGLSKVFLVVRGSGLIETAYFSRGAAEEAAAHLNGGAVLAHAVRHVTKTDGRTTVFIEGGGFSETVEVSD
jgi:hypothetical protein